MNDSLLSSHSLPRLLLGVELCLLYTLSLSLFLTFSHYRSLSHIHVTFTCFLIFAGWFSYCKEEKRWALKWDDSNPKIWWWPIYIISLKTLDMSGWKYEVQIRSTKENLCLWSGTGQLVGLSTWNPFLEHSWKEKGMPLCLTSRTSTNLFLVMVSKFNICST